MLISIIAALILSLFGCIITSLLIIIKYQNLLDLLNKHKNKIEFLQEELKYYKEKYEKCMHENSNNVVISKTSQEPKRENKTDLPEDIELVDLEELSIDDL